ncbi:MAG TPA: hypothetical protein VHG08_12790 [Longimicrobium sp.]|nr:hypothetical protein [Longimicrobium sp.]
MRKLKLELEALTVESFTPAAAPDVRGGTVHAHNHTRGHDSCQFSCWVGCTYEISCYEVCATGAEDPDPVTPD